MKVQRSWTTSEVRALKDLKTSPQGMCLGGKQIVALPAFAGRTPGSIAYAINAHGLADPIRHEQSLLAVSMNPEQRQVLSEFLQNEGRYWPAPMVAEQFNISATTVLRHRREMGLSFTHKEAMTDRVYRRWWKANRKHRLKSYKESARGKHKRILKLLQERAHAVTYMDELPKMRTCAVCHSDWYATDDFFHRIPSKKSDGTRTTYLSGICLACPKKSRPKKEN